jgi:predicted GIY-YIG superfamily endonuclease
MIQKFFKGISNVFSWLKLHSSGGLFYKNWFRHSKVNSVKHIQTHRQQGEPVSIYLFFKTRKVAEKRRLIKKENKESAEIWFLRSVSGYTFLNQRKSTDVYSELKIYNFTERLKGKNKICKNVF